MKLISKAEDVHQWLASKYLDSSSPFNGSHICTWNSDQNQIYLSFDSFPGGMRDRRDIPLWDECLLKCGGLSWLKELCFFLPCCVIF